MEVLEAAVCNQHAAAASDAESRTDASLDNRHVVSSGEVAERLKAAVC
jgi:hypothetical protein